MSMKFLVDAFARKFLVLSRSNQARTEWMSARPFSSKTCVARGVAWRMVSVFSDRQDQALQVIFCRQLVARSLALVAIAFFTFPAVALATPPADSKAVKSDPLGHQINEFYATLRDPIWFSGAGDARGQLLKLLNSADADGLDPKKFNVGVLLGSIREAESGDGTTVWRVDKDLSRAFIEYVHAIQRDPKVGVIYVDLELRPIQTPTGDLLAAAAKDPKLSEFIREMRWMNPLYRELREAIVARKHGDPRERHVLALNLERARALPPASPRYVIINTATQRLTMFENGNAVGAMRVVAGRANAQTPLMNAFIRHAVLNPYWNVPADITAKLAPNVLRRGPRYLKEQGYQVVSSFDEDATVIDATNVDWKAVADGNLAVQMRQMPGAANSMGRVKFMFPNTQGIWLHDTPSRKHFSNDVRLISSGCVRLEDAWRLGSWLFGSKLQSASAQPEQRVELPSLVPVYITYLTAFPEGSSLKFVADVYQRDLPPQAAEAAQNPGL